MMNMSRQKETKDTKITNHHNTSCTDHTMKKKRPTYGPEIKAQALVLYSTGMSYNAIAKLLKIPSHSTIRQWIDPKAAQYHAQYYQQNREHLLQRRAQYRQENKDRIAQYNQENKERSNQRNAQWRQENKEHTLQYATQYYQQNKERVSRRKAQYRKENPEKGRAHCAKRRASKRNATPPWFNSEHKQQCDALHAEAIRLEREKGVQYHVDHIYPLLGKTVVDGKYQHTSCGLHVPWNMEVLPGPDNCSKNCKMPDPTIDPPTAW